MTMFKYVNISNLLTELTIRSARKVRLQEMGSLQQPHDYKLVGSAVSL